MTSENDEQTPPSVTPQPENTSQVSEAPSDIRPGKLFLKLLLLLVGTAIGFSLLLALLTHFIEPIGRFFNQSSFR